MFGLEGGKTFAKDMTSPESLKGSGFVSGLEICI